MTRFHDIGEVSFDSEKMTIQIDGVEHVFAFGKISSSLAKATEAERATFEVSPSGYGIRWPLIDEDLSIDGLLGIEHSPSRKLQSA